MLKLASCLLAWALVLMTACATTPTPASTRGLVSLSPSITETIVALNAADQMVGRSDYCVGPPSVMALPTLGSGLTPNLEGIVAARPKLVLVEGNEAVDTSGISQITTVESLPWLTLADIQASTAKLGVLLDRQTEATALAGELGAALKPRDGPMSPKVLLVIGVDGPAGDIWFIKPNSLHGRALRAAGGTNAVGDSVTGAPSLSAERVLALDPDRIVMLASHELPPAQRSQAIERWRALQPLRAARNGQIHVLAAPNLLTTGPSVIGFVSALSPYTQHQAPAPL